MAGRPTVVGVLALAMLAGCGGTGGSGGVDWENYAPAVKQRIDSMEAAADCAGLQAEFDVAEANGPAQRERTGDGNSDLMGYIDDALSAAGCYG